MEKIQLPYFLTLTKTEQKAAIEAILFTSSVAMTLEDIFNLLANYGENLKLNEEEDANEQQINFEEKTLEQFGFRLSVFSVSQGWRKVLHRHVHANVPVDFVLSVT